MAFTAARTVGKHAAKALEDHNARRAMEVQAMQQNPEAAQAIAEANVRRTKVRAIAGLAAGAMALGTVGFIGYETNKTVRSTVGAIDKGIRDIIGATKAAVPKPSLAVEFQNALDEVILPDKAIVVEGRGRGSVGFHSRLESSAPLGIGWLYNHTVAQDTNVKAYAFRAGKDQLLVDASAIHLRPVQTNGAWHAEADVNIAGISDQRADMRDALDKRGYPMVHAGADFLARLGSSFSTAEATDRVINWADNSFENKCNPLLLTALQAGVQGLVQSEIQNTAGIEAGIARSPHDAQLLRRIGARPVQVYFYSETPDFRGRMHRQAVAPTSIEFPQAYVPVTSQKDHVYVEDGGDCMPKPVAFQQLLTINSGEAK